MTTNKEERHKRFEQFALINEVYIRGFPIGKLESFIDTEVDLATAEAYQRAVEEVKEMKKEDDHGAFCHCSSHGYNEALDDIITKLQALKGEEIK